MPGPESCHFHTRVQDIRTGLSYTEGVYDINDVLARVMLTKFVPFLRADELLEGVAKDVCGDFLKVEPIVAVITLSHDSTASVPDRAISAAHSFSSGKKTGS